MLALCAGSESFEFSKVIKKSKVGWSNPWLVLNMTDCSDTGILCASQT